MKLMKKGEELKYVPDSNVIAMRKLGYIGADENPVPASIPHAPNPEITQDDAAPITEEKFSCPHCGKEYASAAALNRHISAKHMNQE